MTATNRRLTTYTYIFNPPTVDNPIYSRIGYWAVRIAEASGWLSSVPSDVVKRYLNAAAEARKPEVAPVAQRFVFVSESDRFGLLPKSEGRWGSFGVSMVTNTIIMCLLVLFTAAVHKVEKQKYNETLIFPQEVPPPPKIVVPKVKVFAPPQPEVVKISALPAKNSGGFHNPDPISREQTEHAFVPPVVISEPHPQYTPEAAQLRIQGEVTLQVRFLATGQVDVLRVVNGLGHGLDEAAKRVAEQIRFKPATKDGHPVDHTTLIHVTFQLY